MEHVCLRPQQPFALHRSNRSLRSVGALRINAKLFAPLFKNQNAADTLAKGNDQQKKEAAALQKVLGLYADESKKNGVVVKFGDLKGKASAV